MSRKADVRANGAAYLVSAMLLGDLFDPLRLTRSALRALPRSRNVTFTVQDSTCPPACANILAYALDAGGSASRVRFLLPFTARGGLCLTAKLLGPLDLSGQRACGG